MVVDWTKPIEAVHEDGRVASVVFDNGPNENGNYWIKDGDEPEDCALYFKKDGNPASEHYTTWRIRNVQPAAAKPAISDELVERAFELIRTMASAASAVEDEYRMADGGIADDYQEAAAIVAELPEPVDPDEVEARELARVLANRIGGNSKSFDQYDLEILAYEGIKRGRALERGEP